MSLVVAGMDSNPIRNHFFRQLEADPDCDFMFSIFLLQRKFKTNSSSKIEIDIRKRNQIFHYTRCITPKRASSLWGPIPASLRRVNTALFEKKVAAVASCCQHCVQFDQPKIWTSDLPLQRWTRYPRLTDNILKESMQYAVQTIRNKVVAIARLTMTCSTSRD